MYVFLAQALTILLPYGTGDSVYSIECESGSVETAFDTNVHVEVSVLYPLMPETSPLARYANEVVQKEAYELHDAFVQEMSALQDELWEEEADQRTLHYDLSLVHSAPDLISYYGCKYEYRGGVHGSVQYLTKTFLQQNDTIHELTLDDLFVPGYRKWLFEHCEDYFKLNRCGYYSYDDHSWVGFNSTDLDAFLLTENGLLLIFQNYVVSGYDDDPITLLVPYAKLVSIVDPDGPLPVLSKSVSVDHSWATAMQIGAIRDDSSQ